MLLLIQKIQMFCTQKFLGRDRDQPDPENKWLPNPKLWITDPRIRMNCLRIRNTDKQLILHKSGTGIGKPLFSPKSSFLKIFPPFNISIMILK